MNKLVLVMGDLATGKSTFTNREENLKLSKETMELMMFLYSEFAKLNKPLILESNFHTGELERLHEMAVRRNYGVLILVLRGDVEILHKRYLNRMRNENRHPVHLSTTLDVFEDFKGDFEELMSLWEVEKNGIQCTRYYTRRMHAGRRSGTLRL